MKPLHHRQRDLARTVVALSAFLPLAACGPNESASPQAQQANSAPAGIPKGKALEELKAGNARFVNSTATAHTWQQERVAKTGEFGQTPSVGVLSCADSRVPVEMVFDQGVGDLFVVRVAGNSESSTAAGTFEYGVAALGVHTILVLGHTKCGAIDAAVAGKALPGNMGSFTDAIAPAIQGKKFDHLTAASEANVRWQSAQLLQRSELLRAAISKGEIEVLHGIYDVDTGLVRFLD
jgi:carbonic anhydrase